MFVWYVYMWIVYLYKNCSDSFKEGVFVGGVCCFGRGGDVDFGCVLLFLVVGLWWLWLVVWFWFGCYLLWFWFFGLFWRWFGYCCLGCFYVGWDGFFFVVVWFGWCCGLGWFDGGLCCDWFGKLCWKFVFLWYLFYVVGYCWY